MRFVFVLLLLANVALWPLLPAMRSEGLEPERLAQQLHPERLIVIDTPAAGTRPAPDKVAAAGQPADAGPTAPTAPIALPAPQRAADAGNTCIDVGDFNYATAGRFEAELSTLAREVLPARRLARVPPQYIVLVPPQASAAAAVRRLAALRELGFADRDEPSRRWAISLGLFSRLSLAEAQLEKLHAAGISDARVADHPVNSGLYAYRIAGLDEAGTRQLKTLASAFAGVSLRSCD